MVSKTTICLLGASFDTGNLGVSALAWSSVKVIRERWPDAEIVMVGVGRQPGTAQIWIENRAVSIRTWPVRLCPNLLAAHHILKLYIAVFLCRFIPFLKLRYSENDSTLGAILRSDAVCDITGGDSFSDIYGMGRLFRGFLLKRLCQMTGKPFVLLPQTYGPFKSRLSRWMARSVLSRASAIYSRDQEGLEQIRCLMGSRKMKAIPQLCPDLAFILDTRKPSSNFDEIKTHILELKIQKFQLIGLNISGLLYSGGYTNNNQFKIKADYKHLIREIIRYFVCINNTAIILVPHVYNEISCQNLPDSPGENDLIASYMAINDLNQNDLDRIFIIKNSYDASQIKDIIGMCDFFIGSRMHATIAALSQCIPAVGMAYSKKFEGVFQTVGVGDCVADLRKLNDKQVETMIKNISENREDVRMRLIRNVPHAKQKVLKLLTNYSIIPDSDLHELKTGN